MSAQLDFPVIAPSQAAAPAETKQTFAEIVRAQYAAEEPAMKALAAKYKGVAFDCSTTKGLDAAKAARLELREQGRFKLQRTADATKTEANDLKRVIDAESARLIAIVKPVEDEVDSQIKAEEERKAAEKAERERLAAELKAHHDGKIATIRACADRARGLPSDRIANGITQVEALTFGEDCGDFLAQYETAKAETLAAMRTLLDEAKSREAAEALRLENEKIAADLAKQKKDLEEQAAALLASRVAMAHAVVFSFPEPESVAKTSQVVAPDADGNVTIQTGLASFQSVSADLAPAVRDALSGTAMADPAPAARPVSLVAANNAVRAEIAAASEPATIRTPAAFERPMVAAQPAPRAVATPVARITLGQINERLAPIAVTAAGLAELGFTHTMEKASKQYPETDFPKICEALIKHVSAVKHGAAVAA